MSRGQRFHRTPSILRRAIQHREWLAGCHSERYALEEAGNGLRLALLTTSKPHFPGQGRGCDELSVNELAIRIAIVDLRPSLDVEPLRFVYARLSSLSA